MEAKSQKEMSLSAAEATLDELAEEVVATGREIVLTRDGARLVALVDARKLDYYHTLEAQLTNLALANEAARGLEQLTAGKVVSSEDLHGILKR
jgi:PHD/YefM family antitoxin component YafN of YafNO toxin-antitoxin module